MKLTEEELYNLYEDRAKIDTHLQHWDCYRQLFLIYSYAVNSKAKRILELGCMHGVSTFALLQALEETDGSMISVDIEIEGSTSHADNPRWKFICGDSLTVELPDKEYDIVFLDTSHETAATTKELVKYVPMVRKGGYLFVHDTDFEGVIEPLNFFLQDNPGVLEFILKQDDQSQMTIFKRL